MLRDLIFMYLLSIWSLYLYTWFFKKVFESYRRKESYLIAYRYYDIQKVFSAIYLPL